MNYDANSAVHWQISGLFSGASIQKIEGWTFNIQYIRNKREKCRQQSTNNKQKTKNPDKRPL